MVQQVGRLEPVLESSRATDRERPEQREVKVPSAGTVELIPSGRAKSHAGRLRERRRVEPRTACADRSELGERADEIGSLRVARRVQLTAARRYRERRAAECRQYTIHLPIVGDRVQDTVVATRRLPRKRIGESQLKVVP